jgi:hypothetical protein
MENLLCHNKSDRHQFGNPPRVRNLWGWYHSLNHNIPHALSALNSFGEDITRLVSHRLPIDEIAKVFDGEVPNKSLKIQGIKS